MKKLLILFIFLESFTLDAQTQVYHSFPDSNAYWCQTTQWFDGTCDHTRNTTSFFSNDTSINALIYHQIQESGFEYSTLCGSGGYFYSCCLPIRQDTAQRKVYYYDVLNQTEKIMYDFNLQIGDTLDESKVIWGNISYIHVITSIDSIPINGFFRKRFNYNGSFLFGCHDSSIIEGIGGTSGLTAAPSTCFEYFANLTGFKQNGISMYPDSNAYCVVISGAENLTNTTNLYVYPNPFINELNIINNHQNETVEIIIYGIDTQKLLQQKFTKSLTLNLENFAKGIYIYEILTKNGQSKKGKIIKA